MSEHHHHHPYPPSPMKLLGYVARGFTRVADVDLKDLGLATGQFPVLFGLKGGKALSQAELARIAKVEQPSMAQLLNRMERDGLVQRVPDPADKRSRLILLTPLAAKNLHKAKALMDARTQDALAGLTEQEVAQLLALLFKVNANIERMGGDT